MRGFKIIAIKPLKGCRQDYLKILKADTIYYFYNDYSIDENDRITVKKTIPDDFYSVNYDLPNGESRTLDVNISAVVGKNGSGKSAIIELLFRAINNIAYDEENEDANLVRIPDLELVLYLQLDKAYLKIELRESGKQYCYYDGDSNIVSKVDNEDLDKFFYTIAVNYSHYAYNVEDMSNEVNWLDDIFDKNDGYQTPLVINPKRTNGNIDINNENHLVKSRLLANLLRPIENKHFNFRRISDSLIAVGLKLTLNKSKDRTFLYGLEEGGKYVEINLFNSSIKKHDVLKRLNEQYPFNYNTKMYKKSRVTDYILYKLVSIALKYDEYNRYFNIYEKNFVEEELDEYISMLLSDSSHITFKLKQTLHLLRYEKLYELRNYSVSLKTLSYNIEEIRDKEKNIIEFIPPPIFTVDIILQRVGGGKSGNRIEFSKLSSGEKQMAYSVSTLFYHLINLDSVSSGFRIKYKYVNIILEEIELYFHPEMQRIYIDYILKGLKYLTLCRIQAINFIFVTHSPFILSDIPESNILFLGDNGLPRERKSSEIEPELKTFGGNIHELLSHSFFLDNGTIGEFAKQKIQLMIDRLISKPNDDNFNKEELLQEIQLIGEPFLRLKLMEMYDDKYKTKSRIDALKAELKRLEGND